MLPPPVHDPESIRELADDILSQRRYDVPPESLPDRVINWFVDQLGKILGSFVGSGAGTLVAWAIVLAAVGFVIYLVVRHGRVPVLPAAAAAGPNVMVEMTKSAAEWRAEAEQLEAAGRWAEGLRCRHRALVGELVRQGVIDERAGRTAGEHLRDVRRARPQVGPQMAAATDLFEVAWYGGATTGAAEAARFASLEREVLRREAVRA